MTYTAACGSITRAPDASADSDGPPAQPCTADFSTCPNGVCYAGTCATGRAQWAIGFGSTSYDDAYGVAVDRAGNLFVTGRFEGTVDFGGQTRTSAGSDD